MRKGLELFSKVFIILLGSLSVNGQSNDECSQCLSEGTEMIGSYHSVVDAIHDSSFSVPCPQMQGSANVYAPYCDSSLIIPASAFMYSDNRDARSSMWQNLKSRRGIWRSQQFYPRNLKRDPIEYTITMTNSSGDNATVRFPKGDLSQPIRVEVSSSNGEVGSCEYPFSEDIYRMNGATQNKWNSLSEEDQEGWKSFCEEHVAYENRAFEFERNDWKMEVEDNNEGVHTEVYNRCPGGLEWKNMAAKALCGEDGLGGYPLINPLYIETFPNLNIPKSFMTFFDGYGDFNAEQALRYTQAQNVTGREGGDIFLGYKNANGLKFYFDTLGMDYGPSDIQFLYYDGTGQKLSHNSHAAANCHNDMDKWLKVIKSVYPQVQMPTRVAMGYSNGGAAALSFQKEISQSGFFGFGEKEEAQVDLLVTIDPISRSGGFLLNKGTGLNLLSRRRDTTTRHVNIYQDSDYGSFAPLHLTSTELNEADVNIHLTPESMGQMDGRGAHVNILKTFAVQDRVRCEFDNAIGEELRVCY